MLSQNKINIKEIFLFHQDDEDDVNLVNVGFNDMTTYTSLYSPFMRIIINFEDTFDFFKNIKFIGDEQFNIGLYDNYNKKEYTFSVSVNSPKILGEMGSADKKANIIFECVSRDCYDAHRVISKSFTGSGSDIITSILKKNFKIDSDEFVVEATTSLKYPATAPYQSNYRTGLSIIDSISEQDFAFFYQDIDEKYYYKKAETILNGTKKPEVIKFTVNQIDHMSPNHPSKYQFNNFFNNELLYKFGCLNTRYENLDNTSYKINKKDIKIGDVVTGTNFGVGNFFDFIDENKSRVSLKYGNIENKIKREMLIKQLESYELTIKTECDLSRRIGDVVELSYYGFDNKDKKHPLYNGNWLITGIRNDISKNESSQVMNLSKVKFPKSES
jgi:hypothetical protein